MEKTKKEKSEELSLIRQRKKEIEARKELSKQIQLMKSASPESDVGDLTSTAGDFASAAAKALGNLASSGVSALVVDPLKKAADAIKSSFTPVKSSDVFPSYQPVSTSDVFPQAEFQFAPTEGLVTPNQTGQWPSSHPSYYMSGSPYPQLGEYSSDLKSQSTAIDSTLQSIQQAAQQSWAQRPVSAQLAFSSFI